MAYDRFISFKKGAEPSKEDVRIALEDYLGGYSTEISWKEDRWMALLTGHKSWPFRRLEPESPFAEGHKAEEQEERWIEVVFGQSIDVLTRRQDEATNNLADGFARLVARYWGGRLEMD